MSLSFESFKNAFMTNFKGSYNKENGVGSIFTEGYDGRVSVADLWSAQVIPILAFAAAGLLGTLPWILGKFAVGKIIAWICTGLSLTFNSLLCLALFLPSLKLMVKRCHDLNMPWYALFGVLIPMIGPIFNLYILFFPGKDEPNKFGEPSSGLFGNKRQSEPAVEKEPEAVAEEPEAEQEPQA